MSGREPKSNKELYEQDKLAKEYAGADRMVSSHEIAEELKETADTSFIIPTRINTLDTILGGGPEAGEMVVVSGPTSGGKTTLLMSITQNMAADDVPAAWFTLEVTPRQFIRNMGKRGNLLQFYLPRRDFNDLPKEYVDYFQKTYNRPIEMIDWIDFKINESVQKFGVKVIFIDHIHQLFSLSRVAKSRNISFEVGDLVARVKDLAIQHNVIIFLIAHNRDDADQNNRDPYMESVRDSGLVIRYADTVIGIWRVANGDRLEDDEGKPINRIGKIGEFDNKSKVAVWKNRREGTRKAFYMYHINHYLTEDWDHEFKDHYGDKPA